MYLPHTYHLVLLEEHVARVNDAADGAGVLRCAVLSGRLLASDRRTGLHKTQEHKACMHQMITQHMETDILMVLARSICGCAAWEE